MAVGAPKRASGDWLDAPARKSEVSCSVQDSMITKTFQRGTGARCRYTTRMLREYRWYTTVQWEPL